MSRTATDSVSDPRCFLALLPDAGGLQSLRRIDAVGCVVLGDPAYYRRFGFEHDPMLAYRGPPREYFQRLVLDGQCPSGRVNYPAAFG